MRIARNVAVIAKERLDLAAESLEFTRETLADLIHGGDVSLMALESGVAELQHSLDVTEVLLDLFQTAIEHQRAIGDLLNLGPLQDSETHDETAQAPSNQTNARLLQDADNILYPPQGANKPVISTFPANTAFWMEPVLKFDYAAFDRQLENQIYGQFLVEGLRSHIEALVANETGNVPLVDKYHFPWPSLISLIDPAAQPQSQSEIYFSSSHPFTGKCGSLARCSSGSEGDLWRIVQSNEGI